MKNILTVHLPDTSLNSVLNANEATEIILMVKPLPIQKTGLKLSGNASDGTSVESDTLTVDESGVIRYTVPFAWYSTQGTWQLKLVSNEGDSTYISFNTSVTLQSTDNAKVRWTSGVFVITKYTPPSGATLEYVRFNQSTSTSTTSIYSDTLDVGEAGNEMTYTGGLFNRSSSYTGTLTLYGSQNGSSWTSIRSVTRSSGGQTTFNGTDNTYRYYRVRLQSSSGTNNISSTVMLCCVLSGSASTNAVNPVDELMGNDPVLEDI